ncbi:MAG: hypothetical protein ACRD6X_01620 [Pyrinomonadaceae bacterium]
MRVSPLLTRGLLQVSTASDSDRGIFCPEMRVSPLLTRGLLQVSTASGYFPYQRIDYTSKSKFVRTANLS